MTGFETVGIDQIDGFDELPPVIREELEQRLTSAVLSRTIVDGEDHEMLAIMHRGRSMLERAIAENPDIWEEVDGGWRRKSQSSDVLSEEKDED
jgi:hypothetical protein